MVSRGAPVFGGTMTTPRAAAPLAAPTMAPGERAPLPWPVAALAVAALSAGMWAGLGWLVAALL
jgi:hypothetical protein